jgi:uncharacterized membrane protein HdeD (DUF308 family)
MSNKKFESGRIHSMVVDYVKNAWWLLLSASILLVVIGLYALTFPNVTLELFAALLGFVLVAGGVFGIVKPLARKNRTTPLGITVGVIALVIGSCILLYPLIFVEVLVFLFAITLLIKSILALQLSFATGPTNIWLAISGALGIIAAAFLFVSPAIGGIAVLYLLAIYAIILGTLGIADLVSLRSRMSKLLKK